MIAGLPALLVFAEPDLGSAAIFLLIWLGMVAMAGANFRHVLGTIGMVMAAAPFALIAMVTDYQRERVSLFLDPARDYSRASETVRRLAVQRRAASTASQSANTGWRNRPALARRVPTCS